MVNFNLGNVQVFDTCAAKENDSVYELFACLCLRSTRGDLRAVLSCDFRGLDDMSLSSRMKDRQL